MMSGTNIYLAKFIFEERIKDMFYIIDDILLRQKTAAYKARRDINFFVKPDREFYLFSHEKKGIAQIEIKIRQNQVLRKIKEEDVVLIHWPLYLRKPFHKNGWISRMKGFKIAVVHDINSLRNQESSLKIKEEIKGLNQFQVLIIHNEKMEQWLRENGIITRMVILGIFDYKGKDSKILEREFDGNKKIKLVVAGNLSREKAGYLYQMKKSEYYDIHAYGINYEVCDQVTYKGTFEADELPGKLEGDFGLVWDGDSTSACTGNAGNYLRYNNPHKVSLYVRSRLPIIIWEQAALASWVRENEIGFTVNSLEEIDDSLKNMHKDQYMKYVRNLKELSERTEEGMNIKNALKKIEEMKKF